MTIILINFQREKNSEWENGIKIERNKSDVMFLDSSGEELFDLYDIEDCPYDLCINLDRFLK